MKEFFSKFSNKTALDLVEIIPLFALSITALVMGVNAATIFTAAGTLPPFTAFAAYSYGIIGALGSAYSLHLGNKLAKQAKQEFGQEEVIWENAIGQTIKSTVTQKNDLEYAQEKIDHACKSDLPKITEKFQSAAAKVTVVKDIGYGNGQFYFSRKCEERVTI